MVEGIEVVFIVIAMGAAASLGAVAALLLAAALGLVLHRPVAKLPENTLKFVVGVLPCSFGTFWTGEGMGLARPGQDLSIPALNAGFLATAVTAIPLCWARTARTRASLVPR